MTTTTTTTKTLTLTSDFAFEIGDLIILRRVPQHGQFNAYHYGDRTPYLKTYSKVTVIGTPSTMEHVEINGYRLSLGNDRIAVETSGGKRWTLKLGGGEVHGFNGNRSMPSEIEIADCTVERIVASDETLRENVDAVFTHCTAAAAPLPADVRELLDQANKLAREGNAAMAYTLRRVAQRKAKAAGRATIAYGPGTTR